MFLTILSPQGPPPTGSIIWLNVAGVWKQTTVYIKDSGTWKVATPYIKVSGVWK